MNDEKATAFVLEAIRKSGISIVTDPKKIAAVLGENLDLAAAKVYIQRQIITYQEGDRSPDLSPSSITIKNAKGKDETMYTVKFVGDRPKDYVPKNIGKAYKLMEQWPDGSLHALFAGAQKKSYALGDWNWAEGFSRDESKGSLAQGLAPRYGWHMGTGVPSAPHLMGYGNAENPQKGYYSGSSSGHPNGSKRVWVEVSYDATKDFTDIADQNPNKSEKDIRGLIPFGGYYMFQESNLSNWVVASSIKLERIIPEEERLEIMKKEGYDEDLMWRKRCLRPRLKAAETKILNTFFADHDPKHIDELLKINWNQHINELQIASEKESELTYPRAFYQEIESAYASMRGKKGTELDIAIQHVQKKREDFYAAYKKNPVFQHANKALSPEEIGKNREELRGLVALNPQWIDREEAKLLTTNTGKLLGFTKDDVIYLQPDHIRLETPIHEYTHIWDRICQQKEPELWKEGVELMKQTKLWKSVMESPDYQDIVHDDNLVASEVHARLAGRQGAEMLRKASEPKSLIERLKSWEQKYWSSIKKIFSKSSKNTAIKKHCSMDAFIQAPLAALVTQKKLVKESAVR